mgnify:CR=1 FL=1
MSDYISREAAIKIATKYGLMNGTAQEHHTAVADCIALEIAGIPPADAEPVRHGRCDLCKDGKTFMGATAIGTDDGKSYRIIRCPYCGTKTDLEDDNNEKNSSR